MKSATSGKGARVLFPEMVVAVMRWRKTLRWVGLVAVGLTLMANACARLGDDGGAEEGGGSLSASGSVTGSVPTGEPSTEVPPSSSSPSTTTEPLSDEAQIRKLIANWYEVTTEVIWSNNSSDPRLATVLMDPALSSFVDDIEVRKANGHVGRPERDPRSGVTVLEVVASLELGTALICLVDAGTLIDSRSGSVIDDEVRTYGDQLGFKLVDGEWRIFLIKVVEEWKGVSKCDPR